MENYQNFSREQMTKSILDAWSTVMTKEQYGKLEKMLQDMSDEEFFKFISLNAVKAESLKDFFLHQKELMGKLSNDETAWGEREPVFLTEKENEILVERIRRSNPSDNIVLTVEQDEMLIDLWENTAEKTKRGVSIPSDLFFAKTIPLLDCNITVDERGIGGVLCEYRVVVFKDYEEIVKNATENDVSNVGALILLARTESGYCGKTVLPFYIVRGVDSLISGNVGWIGIPEELRNLMKKSLNMQTISQMFVSAMETWYGIQIALLHPQVREIFLYPTTEKVDDKKSAPKKKRKKVVRYIKKHVIKTQELEQKIYGGEKKNKIHALVWYVIGHWRTYTSGKKVFVRPYWKGKLRGLKMNLEDREREIVI